jgi:hypothetical protein
VSQVLRDGSATGAGDVTRMDDFHPLNQWKPAAHVYPGASSFLIRLTKQAGFWRTAGGTPHAPLAGVETLTWDYHRQMNRSAMARRRARIEDVKQGPLVLAIFFATQVLDGALTYWGVTRFGIELEMNSLLAATMIEVGPATALLAAKTLACACGVVLYVNAYLRPLAAVAGLCLGLAVIPWLFLITVIG